MSRAALVHQVAAKGHDIAPHHYSHDANSKQTDGHNINPAENSVQSESSSTQQGQQSTPSKVTHFRSPQNTPSTRTGPPRSLSFAYSIPGSPPVSRGNSKHENGDILPRDSLDESEFPFSSTNSDFRGALEYGNTDQGDRKGKKRESRPQDEAWNLRRWFHESPKEEKAGFDLGNNVKESKARSEAGQDNSPQSPRSTSGDDADEPNTSTPTPQRSGLRRAFSVPHASQGGSQGSRARWSRLRSLIPHIVNQDARQATTPGPSAVTSNSVNITDELITGGLSTLMLRLWFERDEKDQRRIPVLFHRLRIRVSDSLHPMHVHKSVFRIECEYANGAARWVIYRQLRDFVSLHTHYTVSNVYNRNVDNMPEFPRTSMLSAIASH
jgi:phospholipase D1/2